MTPGQDAVKLVRYFEGCKLTAYPDPVSGGDPWTIGWGSTGPDIRHGVVWSQAQCDARLVQDLAKFGAKVAGLIGSATTSQNQFDAMVDFAYNLGLGNFHSSTLLKLHIAGNYAAAAQEFVKWDKAGGHEVKGLKIRRMTEAKLYAGPVDIAKAAQQIATSL